MEESIQLPENTWLEFSLVRYEVRLQEPNTLNEAMEAAQRTEDYGSFRDHKSHHVSCRRARLDLQCVKTQDHILKGRQRSILQDITDAKVNQSRRTPTKLRGFMNSYVVTSP